MIKTVWVVVSMRYKEGNNETCLRGKGRVHIDK